MRRVPWIVVAVVLGTGILAVAGARSPSTAAPTASVLPTTTTTSTTTTAPPTTTTTAPALPVQAGRPIDVPADPYAPEPEVVIGRIAIPALGLDVPLNQGVTLHNIDNGPSHWTGSALPGQAGNVVVAGHRVTRTRPFRHIDDLRPGDEIRFEVGGVTTTYRVRAHEVVTPDQMRIAAPTPTPTVTLFACHPPGSAKYRYVVYGDLVTT